MRHALVAAASVAALAMGMATSVYAQEVGGDINTSAITNGFNDNSAEDNSDNSTNVGDVDIDASNNSDNSINTDNTNNSDNSVDTEDSFNATDNSDNSDNSDHSIADSYNDSSTHRTSLTTQTLTGSVTGTAVSFAAPVTGDQNGAFETGDVSHSGDSFSGSAGVHVNGSNTGFATNIQAASGISANADITFGSP
jgi:ABC-type antimicrobial peptide transport system permease subunit